MYPDQKHGPEKEIVPGQDDMPPNQGTANWPTTFLPGIPKDLDEALTMLGAKPMQPKV